MNLQAVPVRKADRRTLDEEETWSPPASKFGVAVRQRSPHKIRLCVRSDDLCTIKTSGKLFGVDAMKCHQPQFAPEFLGFEKEKIYLRSNRVFHIKEFYSVLVLNEADSAIYCFLNVLKSFVFYVMAQ